MINNYEIVDTFNLFFSIDRNIFNEENTLFYSIKQSSKHKENSVDRKVFSSCFLSC